MPGEHNTDSTQISWGMPQPVEAATLDDALARQRLFTELLGIEPVPIRVARFRIERRLGSGGMGTVWEAYDEELERPVALKFLRRRAGATADKLLAEARSLAKISHPNVIAVYDVGDHEGQVWIAMELVAGKTLRASVGTPADTGPNVRLQWWSDAGRGLQALHALGLVHRDVKPANVLRGDDGRMRLIDFGLVCAARPGANDDRSAQEREGSQPDAGGSETDVAGFAGTYAYAAPEQLRGARVDARADQYSLCVAIWEALSGARPDPAGAEGLRVRPPEMSRRVHRALVRGLSEDPSDRYPTLALLLAELAPRRRRAWIPAAIVSASLAGLIGFGLRPAAAPPDPCAGVDTGVIDHWGPPQSTQILDRLRVAGMPWIGAAIDAWADRWGLAARTSCLESMVQHVRSPQVHDRRMACLERRLDGLAALVHHLTKTDASGIEREGLGPWLEALRPPETCLEAEIGEGGSSPPPAAIADEVHSLRQTLAGAEHGADAVSLRARLASAQAVEARAEELAWPQLQGEAARVRALLHRHLGEAAPARLALGQTLDLARESHDPELEADAWTQLVAVARDLDLDLARARWALERRAKLVTNLARAPRQAARLLAERGLLLGLSGQVEAGEALLLEADASFAQLGPLAAWERAAALRDLGNLRARRGAPAEGLQAFAQARSLELELRLSPDAAPAQPTTGDESGGVAFNEGLMLLENGELDRAQAALERARVRFTAEQGPRGPGVLRVELGMTALADARGDLQAAKLHSERAQALAPITLGPLDRERADVLSAVGTVAFRERRFGDAAEAFERVLNIHAHQQEIDPVDSALATSNLAEALVALGEDRRARQLLEPALVLLERTLGPEHPDLAYALKALGAAELGLSRPAVAARVLARALALAEASGHSPELAETLWLSAQAEWDTGAHALALARAARAQAHYRELGPEWRSSADELDRWLAQRQTHSPSPTTK